ncbi:MAG: hypothetical protein FWF08_07995 [Oscillospiraceae bacterium]|nr:hypothetical protein [Oscillospiraceae bacterium]
MKRVISLSVAVLVLIPGLFLLVSCGKQPQYIINIYPNGDGATVPAGNQTAAQTSPPADNTAAPTSPPADNTAAPPAGTTAPGATDAPTTAPAPTNAGDTTAPTEAPAPTDPPADTGVITDIAQVVAKYNKAANDTYNYKGRVTVNKTDGSQIEITQLPLIGRPLKGIAEGLLPNDYPSVKDPRTFENGVNVENADNTLANYLPPDKKTTVNLETAGVESAKYTPNADGSGKFEITLKPEVMSGFDVPTYNAQASDFLDITNDDLAPFTFLEGTLTYTGTEINVDVNKDGVMTKYYANTPAKAEGNFGYTTIKLLNDCVLEGYWRSNIEFTYG